MADGPRRRARSRANTALVPIGLAVLLALGVTCATATSSPSTAGERATVTSSTRPATGAVTKTITAVLHAARDGHTAAGQTTLELAPHAEQSHREQLTRALADLAGAGDDRAALSSALSATRVAMAAVATSQADWDHAQAQHEAEERAAEVAAQQADQAAAPLGVRMREAVEAELRSLPGNAGVQISWDDPDLNGHLGAVWMGNTTTIMMNASRLTDTPSQAIDVVRHELAHIYQGRVMDSHALSGEDLATLMAPAFGEDGLEKSADCVALRFSAAWVSYTRDCWTPEQDAWVDALIAGRTP